MTTWEEAAAAAMDTVPKGLSLSSAHATALAEIESYVDRIRVALKGGREVNPYLFEYMCDDALQEFAPNATDSEREGVERVVLRTIISKQHDYGHDNILWAGLDGLAIRIHDKVARIKNLQLHADDGVHNESLADSWLDIAGYAVIGIMLCNGTFELDLARDQRVDCDGCTGDPADHPQRVEGEDIEALECTWLEAVSIAGLDSYDLSLPYNAFLFGDDEEEEEDVPEYNEIDDPSMWKTFNDNDCALLVATYPEWDGHPKAWIATQTAHEQDRNEGVTGFYADTDDVQIIINYLMLVRDAMLAVEMVNDTIDQGLILAPIEEVA